MRKYIFLFLLGLLFIPGSILAQSESPDLTEFQDGQEQITDSAEIELTSHNTETADEDVAGLEEVTNLDLQVSDPSLLPTSPFYFFKEIGRGLERAFTFNALKKIDIDLRIASEKASEAKKVAEKNPNDERGISLALVNFQRAQEDLRARLSRLGENSENPNIDALLNKIAERTVAHEKLLEGIEVNNSSQKTAILNIRKQTQATFGEIADKDTAERFQERLQNALQNARGSTLKDIRAVEILDRLKESDQVSEAVKEKLQELRNSFADRASEHIDRFAENGENGAHRLKDALGNVPGDAFERSKLLEEIRGRVSDRAAGALGEARDSLDEKITDSAELAEKVRKQIEETEQKLQEIEIKLRESDREIPQAIQSLVIQAEEHVEKAKIALREGEPKEAFGLSRAAHAIITNILRLIEKGIDAVSDAPQLFDRLSDRVKTIPVPVRPNNDRSIEDAAEGRKYQSRDAGVCERTQILCIEGFQSFSDSTGCGCEQVKTRFDACPILVPPSPQIERECAVKGGKYIKKIRDGAVCPVFACEVLDVSAPCPLLNINIDRLRAECSAKGGKVIEERSDRCGLIGAQCKVPVPPASVDPVFSPPSPEILSSEIVPAVQAFSIKADDNTFSPAEIRVKKGVKVTITFHVSENNVYYAGLDIKSSKFNTGSVRPGGSKAVEFTADESFEFKSYWPASGVLKSTGKIIIE